jgi:hypothetical protein
MRKVLLVCAVLLCSVACSAATVTFMWDLSPDDATLGVTGNYCLLQSKTSLTYGTVCAAQVPRGVNTVTVTVPNGTYYWVVIAVDDQQNKSGYSNEVTAKVSPGKPGNLRIP